MRSVKQLQVNIVLCDMHIKCFVQQQGIALHIVL